jgi:hypothetical protein
MPRPEFGRRMGRELTIRDCIADSREEYGASGARNCCHPEERPEIDNSCLRRSRILQTTESFGNRTVLERREKRRAPQEFVSRPRTLGLFPLVRFTLTKRVPPDKLENQRTPENHPDRQAKKISSADTLLWNAKLIGRNAENCVPPATYRQLRIGLQLSPVPKCATGSRQHLASSL